MEREVSPLMWAEDSRHAYFMKQALLMVSFSLSLPLSLCVCDGTFNAEY